jgi:hypothetical protein
MNQGPLVLGCTSRAEVTVTLLAYWRLSWDETMHEGAGKGLDLTHDD